MTEIFLWIQETPDALPFHIHLPVCLWLMDPHSRAPNQDTSHGNEGLPQDCFGLSWNPSARYSQHHKWEFDLLHNPKSLKCAVITPLLNKPWLHPNLSKTLQTGAKPVLCIKAVGACRCSSASRTPCCAQSSGHISVCKQTWAQYWDSCSPCA